MGPVATDGDAHRALGLARLGGPCGRQTQTLGGGGRMSFAGGPSERARGIAKQAHSMGLILTACPGPPGGELAREPRPARPVLGAPSRRKDSRYARMPSSRTRLAGSARATRCASALAGPWLEGGIIRFCSRRRSSASSPSFFFFSLPLPPARLVKRTCKSRCLCGRSERQRADAAMEPTRAPR